MCGTFPLIKDYGKVCEHFIYFYNVAVKRILSAEGYSAVTVMKPDCHAVNGQYEIRSLYFDTPDDKALREKLDGVITREKYRIRLYNNDPSGIWIGTVTQFGSRKSVQFIPVRIS